MNKEEELKDKIAIINTMEDRFYEIVKDLTPKIDKNKYPDSVFYFKENDMLFEIENSTIWVSYKCIWSVFEREYSMDYIDTKKFISIMVEEYFKRKGLIVLRKYWFSTLWVEEHFKRKGLTALPN